MRDKTEQRTAIVRRLAMASLAAAAMHLAAAFSASGLLRAQGVTAPTAVAPAAPLVQPPNPPGAQIFPAEEAVRQLLKAGHYAEAETAARAALDSLAASEAPDSLAIATAHELVGESLWRLGKGAAAETQTYVQEAIRIRESRLGPGDPLVATSLALLANLQREAGEYAAARASHERALAIREQAFGPDHLDVARSLNDFGYLLTVFGDNVGAQKLYERALAIRIANLGETHALVGQTLYNIGNLMKDRGDIDGAGDYLVRALAIWEEALGPEHPLVAWSLNDYAHVVFLAGRYPEAKKLYERALGIAERALGPDHADVGAMHFSSGRICTQMGDHADARRFYARAIEIYEASYDPTHPELAAVLESYAVTLSGEGDAAAARPLFERVLAIREQSYGPDHAHVGLALVNLGHVLAATSELAAADSAFRRALAILESTQGASHPDVADALHGLGTLRWAQGDLASALVDIERSVAICEQSLSPDHPRLALGLEAAARIEAALGDRPKALADAIRAERISREHLRLIASASSEREALAYALTRPSGLDVAIRSAIAEPAATLPAWNELARSRALVLDEMARRQRRRGQSDNETEAGRGALAVTASRRRLANLVVRGAGDSPAETYQTILDAARSEKERAERELAALTAEASPEISVAEIGLDAVSAALPERSALIAFYRFDSSENTMPIRSGSPAILAAARQDPGSEKETPADHERYAAFVMPPDGDVLTIDVGAADRVDSLAAHWLATASRGGGGPAKRRAEADARAAGDALRRAIWDPVASSASSADRIFIVPDGALLLVNFDALPADSSRYLAETAPVIHYLSAERDLVIAASEQPRGAGMLAIGGADYDAPLIGDLAAIDPAGVTAGGDDTGALSSRTRASRSSACGGFQSLRFEPIPAASDEARRVAAIWGDADVEIRLGAAATETAFEQLAPGRSILHVATHGFFLGTECEGGVSAASNRRIESPLLRSGLAMAGANRRADATALGTDGIITAEEVAGLDLANVEWAVLSACNTGRGDVTTGEGVLGLRRAFQIAGVRTIVMSLWAVDDESARDWMLALYRARHTGGLATAEAARAANLESLSMRRSLGLSTHPYYWAGFIAAGDWR